jgi:hypothetical protein
LCSKYFQSVYSGFCSGTLSSVDQCAEIFDVQNTMKRLRPTKPVGPDGIPSFVTKGCSEIFVPVLKFIFNLSISQNTIPNLWKQAAIVPVFKKGKASTVGNYRSIAILNNSSKGFEFIIHDHVSQFLKSKLNSSQHGFIKSESTVTNLSLSKDLSFYSGGYEEYDSV